MRRYWVGVACREHVKVGEKGGFCQLSHGKVAPVKRLTPGDGLVYYAPKEQMRRGEIVQAFVAIGIVDNGDAYEAEQAENFHPTRRNVTYLRSDEAPIRPMLDHLGFIPDRRSWGMIFHRGVFEISEADFCMIAAAMNADLSFQNT